MAPKDMARKDMARKKEKPAAQPAAEAPAKPKKRKAVAAFLPRPEASEDLASAIGQESFFLRAGVVDAWFETGKAGPEGEEAHPDVLMVTFDNVTSIGAHDPHQPWLLGRAMKMRVSILGMLASKRDWYRNPDAQRLLKDLQEAGFFARFRRVVFIGTSMGAYAALALSALVPGAEVVAFSPQSTLAPDLVPWEDRYPGPTKGNDWQDLPLRDAAETLATASRIWLIYDPFNRPDRLHANRLQGANIERVHVNFTGHRMLREFRRTETLSDLIAGLVMGTMDRAAVSRHLRARREAEAWQQALLQAGEKRGHPALTARAARRLFALYPERQDFRKLAWRLERIVNGKPEKSRKPRKAKEAAGQQVQDSRRIVAHPDLKPPFTGEILTLNNALVLPERDYDQPKASGVLHSDGSFCALSEAWFRARKTTLPPTLSSQDKIRDLPGTHLYAGHFRGHFGHFLVESTARLWALDHLGQAPDSILYLPYRGDLKLTRRNMRSMEPFFRLLGITCPVTTFSDALRVETLIVPELGFGWLERYAGSPGYRDFMQSRLRAAAPAEGGEKLYISRAKLPAVRGGVLGEQVIEDTLARAGYEIFHPELHPLEMQIARYRAAKTVVALDGSALHFAAFVMPAGSRVAMIKRRSTANVADYIRQFRAFLDVTPDVIDVIRNDWVAGEADRVDFRSIGELDFGKLFGQLRELGYLPADFRADYPADAELQSLLHSYQERRGAPFRVWQKGERHGEDESDE